MRPRFATRHDSRAGSITQITRYPLLRTLVSLLLGLAACGGLAADEATDRQAFVKAWQSAASGDRVDFQNGLDSLQGYLLHPYLRYEDLRHRRAEADPAEVAGFLETHRDWAFTPGLETAWLRALGESGRWAALAEYGAASSDTEVRCHYANARLQLGQTAELLPAARTLWAVGKSQPDACDPVFRWLQQQDGITPGLAWERIRLAMEGRQPRLALYLARFLPESERIWADRWYQQDRGGYRDLGQAAGWTDSPQGRDLTAYGLSRLARQDADRAWRLFPALDDRYDWPADRRAGILHEIALWSAVAGSPESPARMRAVPVDARDDRLLEWWARSSLAREDWPELLEATSQMSAETANDSRWRYWSAVALAQSGDSAGAEARLSQLATEASYHGFLAADRLGLPYTICPQEPDVPAERVEALAARPDFARALELRRADIVNWGRAEWSLAVRRLDREELRAAAALAVGEGWSDQAIFALGNSGDLDWYAWRFPLDYLDAVDRNAASQRLDAAWVMGLMRSESAMASDALSSAGARGLMQVTPATATQLARRHSIAYSGPQQLMQPELNVRFGTAYLRDLLDRFDGSPVLASGAYNAGPGAVDRWLAARPPTDPAAWVETLPFFETRDYIPRVLAFATIYDWRMQRPVTRVSARMNTFDSGGVGGTIRSGQTTEVACRAPGQS